MERKKAMMDNTKSPSNLKILTLPPGIRNRLLITSDADEIETWIVTHIGPPSSTNKKLSSVPKKTVAFDSEWKPDIPKWRNNPLAIVQLGVVNNGLFYVLIAQVSPYFPDSERSKKILQFLFHRKDVRIIGISLIMDKHKFPPATRACDLSVLAMRLGFHRQHGYHGVSSLCHDVLCLEKPTEKRKEITLSDWSICSLNESQILYAVMDVWVVMLVFFKLEPLILHHQLTLRSPPSSPPLSPPPALQQNQKYSTSPSPSPSTRQHQQYDQNNKNNENQMNFYKSDTTTTTTSYSHTVHYTNNGPSYPYFPYFYRTDTSYPYLPHQLYQSYHPM